MTLQSDVHWYLDNRADADGDSEGYQPNTEMWLLNRIAHIGFKQSIPDLIEYFDEHKPSIAERLRNEASPEDKLALMETALYHAKTAAFALRRAGDKSLGGTAQELAEELIEAIKGLRRDCA